MRSKRRRIWRRRPVAVHAPLAARLSASVRRHIAEEVVQFDAESAKRLYAVKDTDELVRIEYLGETYVPEAKKLAKDTLASRGIRTVDSQMLDRVRVDWEQQREAELDEQLRSFEVEAQIPSWRQTIRGRLAPYRDVLSIGMIAVIGFGFLSSIFDWSLFSFEGRDFQGFGLVFGLFWLIFVAPTRGELRRKLDSRRGREN